MSRDNTAMHESCCTAAIRFFATGDRAVSRAKLFPVRFRPPDPWRYVMPTDDTD